MSSQWCFPCPSPYLYFHLLFFPHLSLPDQPSQPDFPLFQHLLAHHPRALPDCCYSPPPLGLFSLLMSSLSITISVLSSVLSNMRNGRSPVLNWCQWKPFAQNLHRICFQLKLFSWNPNYFLWSSVVCSYARRFVLPSMTIDDNIFVVWQQNNKTSGGNIFLLHRTLKRLRISSHIGNTLVRSSSAQMTCIFPFDWPSFSFHLDSTVNNVILQEHQKRSWGNTLVWSSSAHMTCIFPFDWQPPIHCRWMRVTLLLPAETSEYNKHLLQPFISEQRER